MVNQITADEQEAAGTEAIIKGVRRRWPWLKPLFADGAYDRGRLASLSGVERPRSSAKRTKLRQ